MKEVVLRRYKRLVEEELDLPQLVLIDGGKGQLSAALEALQELSLSKTIQVIGIAKRLEELFFPGDPIPLYLDKRSETLRILQQLRNEAHRFGITHHRNRRSRSMLSNSLERIDGVGPKTAERLLRTFKSIDRLKKAERQEVEELVGKAQAKKIMDHLLRNEES